MQPRIMAAAAALGLVCACSGQTELSPAPGTQPAPSAEGGATATEAGVSLSAWSQWSAEPRNLPTDLTPILVRIENNSSNRLSVRYSNIKILNREEGEFAAIPPFNLEDETVVEPVPASDFRLSGFHVAPYLYGFYPRLSRFRDPFLLDRLYYDRMFPYWRTITLPTEDMLRLALPEGVIDPGGVANGYVYFEDATDEVAEVTLQYELVTPEGQNFGRVQIPFTVES